MRIIQCPGANGCCRVNGGTASVKPFGSEAVRLSAHVEKLGSGLSVAARAEGHALRGPRIYWWELV